MDKELEKYYNNRFTMMSSQGWLDLVEDVKEMIATYNNVTSINSVDEFHKRQGQIDILNWVLNLKELSEKTYEELNESFV
jgi:CO dehydrogenase/acetyl-CoA synthase beta subunit